MTIESAPLVGVVGGLGPRASTQFLHTIYQRCAGLPEQLQTRVVLVSDPAVPDRTAALRRGDAAALIASLNRSLRQLQDFGVSEVFICCVTAHAVLDELDPALSPLVVSLVDLAIDEVARRGEPHLLACTLGSLHARLFRSHPRAAEVSGLLVEPQPADRELVHEVIYRLKAWADVWEVIHPLHRLRNRYPGIGLMASCTELHLLHEWTEAVEWATIDPLILAAERIAARRDSPNLSGTGR